MLPSHSSFLIQRERYKDLLREAEQERMIRTAQDGRLPDRSLRKIAGWIGAQMIKVGHRLSSPGPIRRSPAM